jgi:hypothetical protein
MKKLLLLLPLTLFSVPAPLQAQQVNVYQGCIVESYYPAHYDRYGNFVQAGVSRSFTPCQQQRNCNPEAGALLGAGIAGAIVGGDTETRTSSWSNNYSRRDNSSGSSTSRYSRNNYWQSLGAGAGALLFGC